jgi:hypothetical protein
MPSSTNCAKLTQDQFAAINEPRRDACEVPMKTEPEGAFQLPAEISISLSSKVMQEVRRLVKAELVGLDLVQSRTKSPETKDTQSKALPSCACRTCGTPVPVNRLFCPKCDSFQGSVAKGQCPGGESHSQPHNLTPPRPAASIAAVTPVRTYFDMARALLLKGKNVFVEEPLTSTAQQAE